jgi:hypothetical protein
MATTVGSTASVSLTTAFIDLSTFDEIECWLYGGKSVNRFRKVIRKSAWFTVIAAQLNRCGTTGDFDLEMQSMFSRAGDYIRDVWLRAELPEVRAKPGWQVRWTRNIGHNLIQEAYLQFNDLTVNKITSFHLDFLRAFLIPEGKINGYDNMIGNIPILTNPYAEYGGLANDAITAASNVRLPRWALNIPLPFYFTRDPHDAIVQAACPFNDVRVTIKFRAWRDLLIVDRINDDAAIQSGKPMTEPAAGQGQMDNALENTNLHLTGVQVWAHYAVIPNGDREKIGEEDQIDTVIEQVQTIPISQVSPLSQPQKGVDLRFAHSIRALFFAMRNSTIPAEFSNYSTHIPIGFPQAAGIAFRPIGSSDPIARAILSYENVDRVNMPADYFTMVAPYYSAVRIPAETGYHLLSYANRLAGFGTGEALQPDGSTNFARLASVNLNVECSQTCIRQASPVNQMPPNTPVWDPEYRTTAATFDLIITASSLSILRFSAGSAGTRVTFSANACARRRVPRPVMIMDYEARSPECMVLFFVCIYAKPR